MKTEENADEFRMKTEENADEFKVKTEKMRTEFNAEFGIKNADLYRRKQGLLRAKNKDYYGRI
jgi:hypothetical protein